MKKYKIYIDFDDVLCETAKLLIRVASSEFNKNIFFEDIYSFDIGTTFKLSDMEVRHVLDVMHKPENLLAIPPIENTTNIINNWYQQGHIIDIVTGRPPYTRDSSEKWLKKHNISYNSLIFVNKYIKNNAFRYHDDAISLDTLKNIPYDFAIDDSTNMLEFLISETNMNVIIFNRPWNEKYTPPSNTAPERIIKRCHNWQDINLLLTN